MCATHSKQNTHIKPVVSINIDCSTYMYSQKYETASALLIYSSQFTYIAIQSKQHLSRKIDFILSSLTFTSQL